MHRNYTALSILFFFFSVVLRFAMLFSATNMLKIGFFACVVFGLLSIAAASFKIRDYSKAFSFEKGYGTGALSMLVSVAMFLDFVRQSSFAVEIFLGNGTQRITDVIAIFANMLLCLLSCFYYVIVSFSYSRRSYDFRLLRLIHFAPLIWLAVKIYFEMTGILGLMQGVEGFMNVITLALAVLSVYFFIGDMEEDRKASGFGVFVYRSFGLVASVSFVSRMLTLASGVKIYDASVITSAVLFFMGMFFYAFAQSIIYRTGN